MTRRRSFSAFAVSIVLTAGCGDKGDAPPPGERDADAAATTPDGAPDAAATAPDGTPDVAATTPDARTADVGGQDAAPGSDTGPSPPGDAGALARKPTGGVFVHLFEWTWPDIAKECELFLGPKGYAAVQVSPPSEHAVVAGYPWWQRYQTVGYALDQSRSGTKAEFVDMVARCKAAGVAVYVDAVINHMTGQASGVGSNGTSYTKYVYPGLYGITDFHRPVCTIAGTDYATNAANVQNCELVGLADLDTGADAVRTKIADYLIALVGMGVRGFRIDAAKHMAPADLDAIVNRVDTAVGPAAAPYYFLEVIDPGGEAVHASDYFDVGRASGAVVGITEFKYGGVGSKFLGAGGEKLADLKNLSEAGWSLLPSDRAVAFVTNHDTQRASAIYFRDAPARDLADVFMLAWPYGYPSVMSGYAFDRATQAGRDVGPPSDANGHTTRLYAAGAATPACAATPATAAAGTWVCEHRVRSTANMVAFRKATLSAPSATNWWDNGANQIAFGRGTLGFVVINGEASPLSRAFQTGLSAGTYCDVVGGDLASGRCTGTAVTVGPDGSATIAVSAGSALAIHAGARLP